MSDYIYSKLKEAIKDKDWEAAHGYYDDEIYIIAKMAAPDEVEELDKIYGDNDKWYA